MMTLDELLQAITELVMDRDLDDEDVAFRGQQIIDHARCGCAELAFDPLAVSIDALRPRCARLCDVVAATIARAMVSRIHRRHETAPTRVLFVAA